MVREPMISIDMNSKPINGRKSLPSANLIVFHAQEQVIQLASRLILRTEIACTFLEERMMKIISFKILGNSISPHKNGQ